MSDNPNNNQRNPGGITQVESRPRERFSVDDALAHLQQLRVDNTSQPQPQRRPATNRAGGPLGREAEESPESDPSQRGNGHALAHEEPQDGIPEPPDLDNLGGDYGPEDTLGAEDGGDDAGAGEDQQADSYFTVTVGNEQRQVSLNELLNGYMRAQDYTKKSSEAAGVQRQFAEAFQQFGQLRSQLEQRLARFTTEAAREFEAPVDWVELARTNPMAWAEKRARFDALKEAETEQARLADLRGREEHARKQEMLRLGNDVLMRAIPEWRDVQKRTQMQAELKEFARSVGYSEQELNGEILDPRYIIVFADAMKYRKMNSRRLNLPPKQDPPRMPQGRGGQAQPTGPSRERRAAVEAFQGKQSVDNALQLLNVLHPKQKMN